MYLVKTPSLLKPLASELLWQVPTSGQEVYLTFDDGPTAGITEQVLDILDEYQAKATFFCIGGNVKRNRPLYEELLERGHRVGNHTWNHMNGWKFGDFSYYRNVMECAKEVNSNLFRPPYGKMTRSQAKGLLKRFTIVMWDVLSADWRNDVSPDQCLRNVIDNAVPGSIVVFHDSEKARKNMLYALPRALDFWQQKGISAQRLPIVD